MTERRNTRINYSFILPGATKPEYEHYRLAPSVEALKDEVIEALQALGFFPGECLKRDGWWEIDCKGHRIILWDPKIRAHTQTIRKALHEILPPPTETT